MRQQEFATDRALMFGMGFTMMMLLGIFTVFVALLIAVGIPWYVVIIAAVGVGILHYYLNDRLVLASTGAKVVTEEEEPHLHSLVERLSALADIPKPKKIAIIVDDAPNAFAAGRNPSNAIVAVTTGLASRLNYQEMEGVLAHELAHIKNRDIMVMNLAMIVFYLTHYLMVLLRWSFVIVGAVATVLMAIASRHWAAFLAVVVGVATLYIYMGLAYVTLYVIQFLNNMFVMSLSRCREYAADRVGAHICGAPMQLASALQRIDDEMARIPVEDLRRLENANAFLIIPALKRNFIMTMFSTHPRTEKRIRKLHDMQRDLERETSEV